MATKHLTIPMFPLNVVLLPGETKTLHIFENRYKQLIEDCLQNEAHFGIPFVNQNKVSDYGIEVKINSVSKTYENGDIDIIIEAVHVFKMIEFSSVLSPKLYGAGVIEYEDSHFQNTSMSLQELTREYLWQAQQQTIPIDAFDNATVYTIARLIELSSMEKFQIIKTPSLLEKENLLKAKLKLFVHLIKTENDLKDKFVMN